MQFIHRGTDNPVEIYEPIVKEHLFNFCICKLPSVNNPMKIIIHITKYSYILLNSFSIDFRLREDGTYIVVYNIVKQMQSTVQHVLLVNYHSKLTDTYLKQSLVTHTAGDPSTDKFNDKPSPVIDLY